MLIHPFQLRQERGGAHHFLGRLFEEFRREGEEVAFRDEPDGAGAVVFVNSFLTPAATVRRFWAAGHPILLRLDGSAYAYGRFDRADRVQEAVGRYADAVVFQSVFSREVLAHRRILSAPGTVIPNAVDTAFFTPEGERLHRIPRDRPSVLFASHSRLFLKGLREFVHLAWLCPEARFFAAGDLGWDALPGNMGGGLPENFVLLGRLDPGAFARALRSADVFCFPGHNDAAPNVVLQALASGCPVWYRRSGGVPEQAEGCGRPISDRPREDLARLLEEREALSRRSRARALDRFALPRAARQYLAAIRSLAGRSGKRGLKRSFLAGLVKRLAPCRARARVLRVGFFLHLDRVPAKEYHRLRASAWIRGFQMVRTLRPHGIEVRLDPPDARGLDLAVILDRPTERALKTSELLRAAGVPYVFDLVTNVLEPSSLETDPPVVIPEEEVRRAERILSGACAISAVSPWLADRAARLHPLTRCLPDGVPEAWFRTERPPPPAEGPLTLGYAGRVSKAEELGPWWAAARARGCRLLVIADRRPKGLDGSEFVPWRFKTFARACRGIDLGLAPRARLDAPYNQGHSAFKIDAFLAQGIPVLAAPVPSYLPILGAGRCGALVRSTEEFAEKLERY
ncbi:MAG: glycosyltransferase, partial [Planctomycetota bacterium]